jgi:hypothetical protein
MFNNQVIAWNYNVAEKGSSHHMVTEIWPILGHVGPNDIKFFAAGPFCARYWIQRIEIRSGDDDFGSSPPFSF